MTELVQTYLPICKPTNSRTPVEVGDAVTFVLRTKDGSYATVDLTLTVANHDTKTYGWNRNAANHDYRASDILRPAEKHTPYCS